MTLPDQLRALSRAEHDDLSIAAEAADEIERLREALTFYANREQYRSRWIFPEAVLSDGGRRAQAALK